MPDAIPIIGGTGALGYGLALRWARAGQEVVIGSRKADRAEEAAAKLKGEAPGANIEGLDNADAAKRGPIVFLTVPFRAQSETLNNLRDHLSEGQILVDCTVPLAAALSGKATRTIGVWQGSAAQQAQEMVPDGVTVISALHTVSAPSLAEGASARRGRPGLRGQEGAEGAGRPADRADRGTAAGERRPARDGPHRRDADPDADLGQRPLQDPRRDQADRAARGDHWA